MKRAGPTQATGVPSRIWHVMGLALLLGVWPAMSTLASPAVRPGSALPDQDRSFDGNPDQAAFEAQWERVLTQRSIAEVQRAYDLVTELYHQHWRVSAADCNAHEGDVASALEINPVGFALRYVAYECAVATGDKVMASRHKAAFDALVRHSLAALPPDNSVGDNYPIRILDQIDAYAFARASGEKIVRGYYDISPSTRYMPLALVLWNETTQRERVIWFDFLNSVLQMRGDPETAFEGYRKRAVQSILAGIGKVPGTAAYEANAYFNGAEQFPDNPSRLEWAGHLADGGNYIATLGFAGWCFDNPDTRCEKRAVGLLTRLAERGDADAMLWLALAYADGHGVAPDRPTAHRWIAKADARRGGLQASLQFAASRLDENNGAVDPLVREDVERLARAGEPYAVALVANAIRQDTGHYKFTERLHADLEKAARAGLPFAAELMAQVRFEQNDDEGGLVWLKKAAAAGDSFAQSELADIYRDASHGVKYDLDRAIYWNEQAAQRGEAPSARLAGFIQWRELPYSPDNHYRAQRWLQDATASGDGPGTFYLAQMYEQGGVGIEGNVEDSARLYRWLVDKRPGDARARWFLARLLREGKVAEREPGEQERLEREAAASGDGEQLRYLAYALLFGEYGASDPEVAASWFARGAAKGDNPSRRIYGLMLLDGIGVARDVDAAFKQLRTAIDADSTAALQDMAFELCTHARTEVYDPKEGLRLANKFDASKPSANNLETLAACQAGNGQFQEAIASAHAALGLLKQNHSYDYVTAVQDIRDELASYQAGKRYVWPEPILRTRIQRAQARLERSRRPTTEVNR
jgi:uncharacterized protein